MNKGVLTGLGPGDSPDVLAGDAGQNAVLVAGNRKEVAFSFTAVGATPAIDCSDYRWVSVQVVSQGASSTVNFQGSNDGVNWVGVQLSQPSTSTPASVVSITAAGVVYSGAMHYRFFRLNITGIVSGTTAGVVEFFSMPGPSALQLVTGSILQSGTWNVGVVGGGTVADVLASDSGQNAQLVAGNRKEVSFSTTTAQAVATTDCSDYRYVSVHTVAQGASSTVNFQGSNDNINWMSVELVQASTGAPSPVTNTTFGGGICHSGFLPYRYFRLNVTGISSGTTSGVVEFFSMPGPPGVQSVYLNGFSTGPVTDAYTPGSAFTVAAGGIGFNGNNWDRLRTPATFKTATATAAGDTALWTPTSGKKFRLMRYQVQITGDAATASGAEIDIVLRDGTTALAAAYSLYVPAASISALGSDNSGWLDLGNGILSAAANNVLNINLSAALTSGKVRVVCAGTEE